MNSKSRLLAAYRAIGPDTVNRLMRLGDLPAHTREDVFSKIARSDTGTYGTPRQADIERYGQAAYVYAHLHTCWREIAAWTGKRDWIVESAKAAALADVPVDQLTDLELGCRVYTAIVEEGSVEGEIVEEYVQRRQIAITDVARELGLAVQKTSSTSLHRQRKEGISGQAMHALWGAMRDRLDFKNTKN